MNRGTVRVRLTVLFGGLFLITSTILLVVVNLLLRRMLAERVLMIRSDTRYVPGTGPGGDPPPGSLEPPTTLNFQGSVAGRAATDLSDAVLKFQWWVSGVTIVVLAIVSLAIGWWLAGRVLSPLHRITATARRLSMSNLDQRIALTGPRDELKELADTFDAMLDRLEQSADSQRQFVANASHEMRTPLAIQRAAIEIGLDNPTPERLTEVKSDLLTANRRTERLIDGLLTLAQGDRGLDIREPVPLDAVVREAASEVPANDVTLNLNVEPVTVNGDPVLLGRLVANLLDNAVRYNRPGGAVWVNLSAAGSLTVYNTGPEIPQERIAELFEPFRRLQQTRTRTADGAGLGLSIVNSIAQAHGAVGWARPNPEGGLTFSLQFPTIENDQPSRDHARNDLPVRA
ncbi:MAG TPA: ATP-binding protein [Kineosporiaceae bacterium]|nr:ATP-binding protein [Kineosporiaceae bacterium]